jgi:hypothetical protein
MKRHGARAIRTAVSLVEAMVAALILSVGGLAIQGAQTRGTVAAAWSADRVLAEALLRDLVEAYQAFSFNELLHERPEVRRSEQPERPDASDAVDELPVLADRSFGPRPDLSEASSSTDPICRAYREMHQQLRIRRAVLVQESSPGTLVVTCTVRWTNRFGKETTVRRQFLRLGRPAWPLLASPRPQ